MIAKAVVDSGSARPIPPWPDPHSSDGLLFFRSADAVFDAARALGYPTAAAIGAFVTMAEAESSFDPGPASGKAGVRQPYRWGLYRWSAERADDIKKGCGIDVRLSRNISEQVAAAAWELKNHRYLGKIAIDRCWSAPGAAHWAAILFEGVAAPGAPRRRERMARRWCWWVAGQWWSPAALLAAL